MLWPPKTDAPTHQRVIPLENKRLFVVVVCALGGLAALVGVVVMVLEASAYLPKANKPLITFTAS